MEGMENPYRSLAMIFMVLATSEGVIGVESNEFYCSMNLKHTMCSYTRFDSMQLRCHDYNQIPSGVLDPSILDKHNSLRNYYASHGGGNFTVSNIHGGGNFTVPNMLALEWDNELAAIAARWAWQCPYFEDDFRDVDRFKVANLVGLLAEVHHFPELDEVWQSLTVGNHTFHKLHHHRRRRGLLKSAFRLDEPLSLLTNPYFKHVGCAGANYRQVTNGVDEYRTILVCNYGPLDSPYNREQPSGPPCSRCPSATSCNSSSTYNSLCVESLQTHKHNKQRDWNADQEIHEDQRQLGGAEQYYAEEDEGMAGGSGDGERGLLTERNYTEEYCGVVCNNGKKHTLCEYQVNNGSFSKHFYSWRGPQTWSPPDMETLRCCPIRPGIRDRYIDNSQRTIDEYDEVISIMGDDMHVMVLNVHNIIRDNFAAGNRDESTYGSTAGEKNTGLPLAANMREMQWNEDLATIALMWAIQCQPTKDNCRDSFLKSDPTRTFFVSQLVDSTNWTGKEGEFPSPENSFFKWYNSWKYFTADDISPYRKPSDPHKDYSSFAQVIWADSYLVGCAMTLCRNRSSSQSLIITVCNYGPGGMMVGHNVYIKGGPCTHCKRISKSSLGGMYCSKEYPNMCSDAASVLLRLALLALPCIFGLLMTPQ